MPKDMRELPITNTFKRQLKLYMKSVVYSYQYVMLLRGFCRFSYRTGRLGKLKWRRRLACSLSI